MELVSLHDTNELQKAYKNLSENVLLKAILKLLHTGKSGLICIGQQFPNWSHDASA